jgi:hypothetical protein
MVSCLAWEPCHGGDLDVGKLLPQEQVQVATKFGMRREYVRACCVLRSRPAFTASVWNSGLHRPILPAPRRYLCKWFLEKLKNKQTSIFEELNPQPTT